MRYFFDEKYMPKDLGGQTPIVVKVARVICVKPQLALLVRCGNIKQTDSI